MKNNQLSVKEIKEIKEIKELGLKIKVCLKTMYLDNFEDFNSFYGKSYFLTTEKLIMFFHLDGYNKLSITNRKKHQSYYIDLNNFTITSNKFIKKSDLHFIFSTFYMLYENMKLKLYFPNTYGKVKLRFHNNLIINYYKSVFDNFKRSELRMF